MKITMDEMPTEYLVSENREEMMKKISVIIPCYNVEQWIDRCIGSVAVQTIGMENLENWNMIFCSTQFIL